MARIMSFWALSLVVVGTLASAVTAQVVRSTPRVVSGADVGFRIEGMDRSSGKPVGTLVIRVDGQWVEPGSVGKIAPATSR